MADLLKVDARQVNPTVNTINSRLGELQSYIDGELTSFVNSFAAWWEGAAYESFKEDFAQTKSLYKNSVHEELEAYIKNLRTAISAQQTQDTSNAGHIKIN